MPNKALRILIVDEQHFHRMKTERLFNQLGYYRVAPVHSLAQMLTLIEYGYEPFDLVVINASLAGGAFDLPGFFLDNGQVNHTLIYDGQQARLPLTPAAGIERTVQQKVQVSHAALPDLLSIQQLMALIDPLGCEGVQSSEHERYRQRIG
ncbi:response regulator [Pseudomonas sp. A-RE-19]|uniref:response regulator n=1 Tax=Pseudomonas sp. A-RE-19 TaxID=2832401 RepID=UPI001CBC3904|nr:response regulator [Pseudomonas sp. A-RE-19]